jgi:hypothetical protein
VVARGSRVILDQTSDVTPCDTRYNLQVPFLSELEEIYSRTISGPLIMPVNAGMDPETDLGFGTEAAGINPNKNGGTAPQAV